MVIHIIYHPLLFPIPPLSLLYLRMALQLSRPEGPKKALGREGEGQLLRG